MNRKACMIGNEVRVLVEALDYDQAGAYLDEVMRARGLIAKFYIGGHCLQRVPHGSVISVSSSQPSPWPFIDGEVHVPGKGSVFLHEGEVFPSGAVAVFVVRFAPRCDIVAGVN